MVSGRCFLYHVVFGMLNPGRFYYVFVSGQVDSMLPIQGNGSCYFKIF